MTTALITGITVLVGYHLAGCLYGAGRLGAGRCSSFVDRMLSPELVPERGCTAVRFNNPLDYVVSSEKCGVLLGPVPA